MVNMTDYLGKGKDAATGDTDAIQYLFLGFLGLAAIAGVVMGGVYGLAKGFGSTAREALTDAVSSASESASEAGDTIRVN